MQSRVGEIKGNFFFLFLGFFAGIYQLLASHAIQSHYRDMDEKDLFEPEENH